MKTGMLWFDDDPKKSLEDKVGRAAQRYSEKYGQAATIVYINPATAGDANTAAGLSVKQVRSILPNHFWLGVEAVQP